MYIGILNLDFYSYIFYKHSSSSGVWIKRLREPRILRRVKLEIFNSISNKYNNILELIGVVMLLTDP